MQGTKALALEIDRALDGLRLLDHPFYQRWQMGELSAAELTEYAEQYRHFEAELPKYLGSILAQLPEDSEAASFIADNLNDEAGDPSHLDLFNTFLDATGGSADADAMPGTAALVGAYRQTVSTDTPAAAIAGLIAYEAQASGIADTKGQGLRDNYDYARRDTVFWDVHATLDVDHAEWAVEALAAAGASTDETYRGANTVAQAWWGFLDERQARAELINA